MLLTFRYRVKDATAGKRLARMAVAVTNPNGKYVAL
jgi:hypothetical protein